MTWIDRTNLFSALDFSAVIALLLGWLIMGFWIENSTQRFPSTTRLVSKYRRDWMVQMITREPRIFDAQLVGNLRQGTAFFASTSVIALGGVLAILGNSEQLTMLADDFVQTSAPRFVWEIKLIVIALFLTNAFLKFVWSNRLFGYVAVLMGSVPNDTKDPLCLTRAQQAGELNILAAMSFNRGLRALYFALTACAWLAGGAALLAAVFTTVAIIWRREFASKSRSVLLNTQT